MNPNRAQSKPSPRPTTTSVTLQWEGKPDLTVPGPEPLPVSDVEMWQPPFDTPIQTAPQGDIDASAWTNTLIHADAVAALDGFRAPAWYERIQRAGGVKLIYLDPPFATGQTFSAERAVGRAKGDTGSATVSIPAYRDAWADGLAGYLTFMTQLLTRAHALLADDGWLCVHVDHRASAHLRVLLDEICGANAFINEIIWSYGLGNNRQSRGFARKHDTLLLYAKSPAAQFFTVRGEVTAAMRNKYRHVRPDGTRFMRSYGKEYDLKGGKPLGSVWEIPSIAPTSRERRGYPTQKPEALLERLLLATTQPGDLVLDPCAGSGTTLAVAERLERHWLGIDQGAVSISMIRERLFGLGAPFRVISTGLLHRPKGSAARCHGISPAAVRDGETVTVRLQEEARPSPAAPPDATPEVATPKAVPVRRTRPRALPSSQITGLDAVTGWAVGFATTSDPDDIIFQPVWAAFHESPECPLPFTSDPISLSCQDIRELRVRSYFLDGTTQEDRLPLP